MNRYDEAKETIEAFRRALNENVKSKLNEEQVSNENTSKEEGIPYTSQDELMISIIETCRKQFGADFSNIKTPMLYYPADGDVILSGVISGLNEAKFQFRLKDPTGEGCFIWSNPMQLTENNLRLIKVIYGVFKNWKNELDTTEDKKPMSLNSNTSYNNLTPGDDY